MNDFISLFAFLSVALAIVRIVLFNWAYLISAPNKLKEAQSKASTSKKNKKTANADLKKAEKGTTVLSCIIDSNNWDFFIVLFLFLAFFVKTGSYIQPLTPYELTIKQEIICYWKNWTGGEVAVVDYLNEEQMKQGHGFNIKQERWMIFYSQKGTMILAISLPFWFWWSFHDDWAKFKKLWSMDSSERGSFLQQGGHNLAFYLAGGLIYIFGDMLNEKFQNQRIHKLQHKHKEDN